MKPLTAYPRHKRKKLNHIRTKFDLINGFMRVGSFAKVSKILTLDEITPIINDEINEVRKSVMGKYKINLSQIDIQTDRTSMDLLKDLVTIKITAYNPIKAND